MWKTLSPKIQGFNIKDNPIYSKTVPKKKTTVLFDGKTKFLLKE